MNTKNLRSLSALSISMLAVAATAQASVVTAPDSALQLAFATDGSTQFTSVDSVGTAQGTGLGVGYDPANRFNAFTSARTAATAQSVYNNLITDTSAAGNFSTINAGTAFQLGLHAYGSNNAGTTQPITLFASLFNFDPTAAAGTIPIGSAIFRNVSVDVFNQTDTTDGTFFSSTFTLANSIIAGNQYVLAVNGGPAGGATPTSFGTADRIGFGNSGLSTADASIFKTIYLIDNNSGDTGGVYKAKGNNNPLAYQFYAGSSAPVPESTNLLSFGALLGLGGLCFVRRRSIS